MFTKISDGLPIVGGAGGGLLATITLYSAVDVIFFTIIGAVVGFFMKILLEWCYKKIKKLFKVQ